MWNGCLELIAISRPRKAISRGSPKISPFVLFDLALSDARADGFVQRIFRAGEKFLGVEVSRRGC